MKKLFIFFSGIVFLCMCSTNNKNKEINIEINKNIETLSICFEIADNGFWNIPFDDFQPMKNLARKRFYKYRDNQIIHLIDTLVKKGFWLDGMIEIVIKSSPIPEAKLINELDQSTISRLSENKEDAINLANEFLASLNKFYIETNILDYFLENKSYYDSVIFEVRKNLPDKNFIRTMETYYGKYNDSYTLIPVPTLWHTAGLGMRIKGKIGYRVFNIFGPVIVTKDSTKYGYGYNSPNQINELTVHEFGHSFINPITELKENRDIIDKYKYLFEFVKDKMSNQGYNNWWTCVTEHIVRLGEIRISYALDDSARANRIRSDYINNRSFIFLPYLEHSIADYEENRDTFTSIDDYLPILLESFGLIDTLKIR